MIARFSALDVEITYVRCVLNLVQDAKNLSVVDVRLVVFVVMDRLVRIVLSNVNIAKGIIVEQNVSESAMVSIVGDDRGIAVHKALLHAMYVDRTFANNVWRENMDTISLVSNAVKRRET